MKNNGPIKIQDLFPFMHRAECCYWSVFLRLLFASPFSSLGMASMYIMAAAGSPGLP